MDVFCCYLAYSSYAILLDSAVQSDSGWRSWFIEYNSSHFVAYLTINGLLSGLFIVLVAFVIAKLKATGTKAPGR